MLVFVMLYHLGYDLTTFFGVHMPWFWDWPVQSFRDGMVGTLLVISGVSCSLSRSNLRRGLRTLGIGMAITAATVVLAPSQSIWFGVLHCYGVCMILWAFFGTVLSRLPGSLFAALFGLLFVITRFVPMGALLLPTGLLPLPPLLYQSRLLFWLGFPDPSFASADYYPLIPWAFLFAAGGVLGARWEKTGFPAWTIGGKFPALAGIGRHTLVIYLVHQPILLILLWVFFHFSMFL
jgi:uncharacterized membrane protein